MDKAVVLWRSNPVTDVNSARGYIPWRRGCSWHQSKRPAFGWWWKRQQEEGKTGRETRANWWSGTWRKEVKVFGEKSVNIFCLFWKQRRCYPLSRKEEALDAGAATKGEYPFCGKFANAGCFHFIISRKPFSFLLYFKTLEWTRTASRGNFTNEGISWRGQGCFRDLYISINNMIVCFRSFLQHTLFAVMHHLMQCHANR